MKKIISRAGVPASIAKEGVQLLMQEHGISRAQLGVLAHAAVQHNPTSGGYGSSTVGGWLTGRYEMPFMAYELVCGKLWFVKQGSATLEQAMTMSLVELLEHTWPASTKVTSHR